ncbi:hypothetical protein ACFLSW_03305 [Candidatus Bipolaricaulota bacterium]
MTVKITDFARWQLRLTAQDLRRKRGDRATQFAKQVAAVLSDRSALEDMGRPMSGLPELPFLEVAVDDYRLFFRTVDDTLWLAGVWPPLYDE